MHVAYVISGICVMYAMLFYVIFGVYVTCAMYAIYAMYVIYDVCHTCALYGMCLMDLLYACYIRVTYY